jgi:hypothetical protein
VYKEPTKKGKGKKVSSGSDDEPVKKKRQASLFNLFVKDKMAALKATNPENNGKENIKMASEAWKTDPFAAFLQDKDKIAELKSEHSDSDNETLYNLAKDAFEGADSSEVAKPATKPTTKPQKQAKGGKGKGRGRADTFGKGGKGKGENAREPKPPEFKAKIICKFCKKTGHYESSCWSKEKAERKKKAEEKQKTQSTRPFPKTHWPRGKPEKAKV